MTDDPFQKADEERARRAREHEELRDEAPYREQSVYLSRLTRDFILGIRAMWLAFTRYPDSGQWLQSRFTDDFLESAVSIYSLASQGVFNAGKREMRYMLEAAVKYVFVDQQLEGDATLESRLAVLNDTSRVPRSTVDPVDKIILRMVPDSAAFSGAVHSSFGALSAYTHMSARQLEERFRRAERGEFSGFEGPKTLESFNGVIAQTYDLVLVLLMEGIGPTFTGDLFVQVFDGEPGWKFHKGRFVREVSRTFDYKAERSGTTTPSSSRTGGEQE